MAGRAGSAGPVLGAILSRDHLRAPHQSLAGGPGGGERAGGRSAMTLRWKFCDNVRYSGDRRAVHRRDWRNDHTGQHVKRSILAYDQ
jgi:hypothetical protein